jgi:nitrite reductase (NO-forming)
MAARRSSAGCWSTGDRRRVRLLVAAGLLTVGAVAVFSAIGIFVEDATPSQAVGAGGSSSAASPSGLAIELVDIAFRPRELSIPADTPTVITLVNRGASVHNFTIDQLDVHTGDLRPGESATVTIDAPPGAYAFYCSVPGHRAAGMVGTLTVQ